MVKRKIAIDSVMKSNPCIYKSKYINEEKIIVNFCEKELLLSKLWKFYYPEPDSHIKDKVKVVLDVPNYAI